MLHAPGLQVLTGQRRIARLPPGDDSEPVMFELKADSPGPCRMSITAWLGGTYLGELTIETSADRDRLSGNRHRDFLANVDTAAVEGAVSLVVRYDPTQNAYRFEFRDEDNPDEVPGQLAYEPGPRVERLVAELDRLARGRAGVPLPKRGTTSGKPGWGCGESSCPSSCDASSGIGKTGSPSSPFWPTGTQCPGNCCTRLTRASTRDSSSSSFR